MARKTQYGKDRDTSIGWHERAACRSMDQELFYGEDSIERTGERISRERRAKSVCSSCQVAERCLQYALDNNEVYGIWGGLTEKERKSFPGRRVGLSVA